MPLRLLEVVIPGHLEETVGEILESHKAVSTWRLETSREDDTVYHAVLRAEGTEALMDAIEEGCPTCPELRMVLLPVEAAVPHPEPEEPEEKPEEEQESRIATLTGRRISREEIYADAREGAESSISFFALMGLSAVVASVGLLRDNVAVIIGAMVIAPLFGPNMGLAVGTTLGDRDLISHGLRTLAAGIVLTVGVSLVVGLLRPVDPSIPAIATRTAVSYSDVVLALAAGAAGTFAFMAGQARALIGVMVAVALVPPLSAFGLLVGSGNMGPATGAVLQAAVNVICINLAGVAAFLIQGLRPRSWWEAEKAKSATRRAALIWTVLLALLVVILAFQTGRGA